MPQTMQTQEQETPSLGFVQNRLPWLAAAGALVVYLLTVNRWICLESLPMIAKITGWDWTPPYQAPLFFLLTWPFRFLPSAWQPLSLNLLTVVLASLTLAMLARSVALLPYDRTRDERLRERSESSLLSIPFAWAPPLLAVVLLGLQLTFWEHAVAATGEMLDLALFAYLVRCLLEYRIKRRETWLTRLALVYGLSTANNYAMIGFFPFFLIALIWIKGFEFFRLSFLVRMLLFGMAGLLAYLILPLSAQASSEQVQGFWQYLRIDFAYQKLSLGSAPPYVVLLLSLTSVFPLLVRGFRMASTTGDVNVASAALTTSASRLVHALLLIACMSVFFDAKWSARALGLGLTFLPFYYLAAIAAAYLAGFFMLITTTVKTKSWQRSSATTQFLGHAVTGIALLALVAAPAALAVKNLPVLRLSNGQGLAEMARLTLKSLPEKGAYLISDDLYQLLILEAAMEAAGKRDQHLLISSRLLESGLYHTHMAKRHPGRWPLLHADGKLPDTIDSGTLASLMTSLARSNEVYYLHPSMGYYFEALAAIPQGLVLRLKPLSTNITESSSALTAAQVTENEKFWKEVEPFMAALPKLTKTSQRESRFLGTFYSRALNWWGVTLQREQKLDAASRAFQMSTTVNPDNTVAQVNMEFNAQLRKGQPKVDLLQPLDLKQDKRSLDELLLLNGPFDAPVWCFRLGQVYAQEGLFRQALAQFQRVRALAPESPQAVVWLDNMVAMSHLTIGDSDGAMNLALQLKQRFPKDDNVLETLTQIYFYRKDLSNALASIDQQIELNPANERALLNKGAISIHLKAYQQAIPPLDKLLTLRPDHSAALMNRAIACLQTGKLDDAERDYQALRKQLPKYHAVYYGLAEIALRRKDKASAIARYEDYIKYGDPASQEFKEVEQKLKELKGGGAR